MIKDTIILKCGEWQATVCPRLGGNIIELKCGGMDVLPSVEESVRILMEGPTDYEFRTTVVREFHRKEDLVEAARMIKGAKNYYLQQFVDSGRCIEAGFTAYSREEMLELQKEVQKIIPNVQLRGV